MGDLKIEVGKHYYSNNGNLILVFSKTDRKVEYCYHVRNLTSGVGKNNLTDYFINEYGKSPQSVDGSLGYNIREIEDRYNNVENIFGTYTKFVGDRVINCYGEIWTISRVSLVNKIKGISEVIISLSHHSYKDLLEVSVTELGEKYKITTLPEVKITPGVITKIKTGYIVLFDDVLYSAVKKEGFTEIGERPEMGDRKVYELNGYKFILWVD